MDGGSSYLGSVPTKLGFFPDQFYAFPIIFVKELIDTGNLSIGWKFHTHTSCDSVLNCFSLETVWTLMHMQLVYKFILSPDFNSLLSGDVYFCINPFREKTYIYQS